MCGFCKCTDRTSNIMISRVSFPQGGINPSTKYDYDPYEIIQWIIDDGF